jgi:putative FmdB family regulatory protein
MPKYDYQCESCSYVREELVTYDDRDLPLEDPCPNCGETGTIKRLLCSPPVVGYHSRVRMRTSENFNDRLKDIAKNRPDNNTIKDSIR